MAALFPPTSVAMSDEEHRKLQQLNLKLQQLSCGKQVHAVRSDRRRDLRLMSSGSVDSLPANTSNNCSPISSPKVAVTRCSSAGKLNHHHQHHQHSQQSPQLLPPHHLHLQNRNSLSASHHTSSNHNHHGNRLADSNNNHSQSPIKNVKPPDTLPPFRDNFRLSSAHHSVQHKLPVKPNGQLPPLKPLVSNPLSNPLSSLPSTLNNGPKLTNENLDFSSLEFYRTKDNAQFDSIVQTVDETKENDTNHESSKGRFSVAPTASNIDRSDSESNPTQSTVGTTHCGNQSPRLQSIDVQLPKLFIAPARTIGEHLLEQLPETPDEDLYSEDSEPITVVTKVKEGHDLHNVEEEEEEDYDGGDGNNNDLEDSGDESDDESDSESTRGPLIRSTSLKTTNTEPITPGRKKMVRFADALGN